MEHKKSVLIVDDDIALMKMAEELLRERYAISLAKSGEQALKLLKSGFMPDLVLLDIDMPGMDGYETLAALKPLLGETPVVFLTGLTQTEAELKGLRAGASDYITKPFDHGILLARIELHLRNSEQVLRARALRAMLQASGIDEERFVRLSGELTPTEQKVARLIALGYSNQEICAELHYSYAYVKKVVCVVFDKLDVNKRSELRKLFCI